MAQNCGPCALKSLAQSPSYWSTAQPNIGRDELGAVDGNAVACRMPQGLTAATGLRDHHCQSAFTRVRSKASRSSAVRSYETRPRQKVEGCGCGCVGKVCRSACGGAWQMTYMWRRTAIAFKLERQAAFSACSPSYTTACPSLQLHFTSPIERLKYKLANEQTHNRKHE